MAKCMLHVVGARPNFMKIAPVMREMSKSAYDFEQILVHTGQHYDASMSEVFFNELHLPKPDINLEVGSGSHAWQTAQIMQRFEPVLLYHQPDWVIVPGDVNSTLACALVASKLGIRVAHVESGLRSFDRTMPEEINRIVTDHIADLLFTTEESGNINLRSEGISEKKIIFAGNTMIDTLIKLLPKAEKRWPDLKAKLGLERFILVTLHRPSNVDVPETLSELIRALSMIGKRIPVVFPVHPRTLKQIVGNGLREEVANEILLCEPFGYLDFLALEKMADLVITDSGGIQEETTFLGVPCITIRPNTERLVTITQGTNRLAESKCDVLTDVVLETLTNTKANPSNTIRPELWDGKAAYRITESMKG